MAQRYFNFTEDLLLKKAIEVGNSLMRAFDTSTGMPYGTVNLKHGIPVGETPIVCVACTSTYSMEFGWLSILTGNRSYYDTAKRAVRALWKYRQGNGVFASHIHALTGEYKYMEGGISGGIDSFYEYLVKSWIMFGDEEYGSMFEEAYHSVLRYVRDEGSGWYVETDSSGSRWQSQVSSLVAFWPGMQVLFGDLVDAHNQIILWASILQQVQFLPEMWNVDSRAAISGRKGYPLRPEYIESLWYMHEATGDSLLLQIGEELFNRIEKYCKAPCGYADIADVETLQKADTMQSFFLSETLKYYYLLFSPKSEFASTDWLFTTEAHPLPITRESIRLGKEEKPIEKTCRALLDYRKSKGSLDKNWKSILEGKEESEEEIEAKQSSGTDPVSWLFTTLFGTGEKDQTKITKNKTSSFHAILSQIKGQKKRELKRRSTCDRYQESPNQLPRRCNFDNLQVELSWAGQCPVWQWKMSREWFFHI